jgi:hypothetical protein
MSKKPCLVQLERALAFLAPVALESVEALEPEAAAQASCACKRDAADTRVRQTRRRRAETRHETLAQPEVESLHSELSRTKDVRSVIAIPVAKHQSPAKAAHLA